MKIYNINIVGNGFDKMNGLDSTYSDFLEFIKKQYKTIAETNFLYIEMLNFKHNNSWIDCELYLNDVFNGLNHMERNGFNFDRNSTDLRVFLNYLDVKYGHVVSHGRFMESSDEYNFSQLIKLYDPFEEYKILNSECISNQGSILMILTNKIQDSMLGEYYELKNLLIEYLKKEETKFAFSEKLKNYISDNKLLENSITLNFNYTNTANEIFDNVYHIHGNLNDDIVWGYYGCKKEDLCKSWQILCLNNSMFFKQHLNSIIADMATCGEEIKVNFNVWGHSIAENDRDIYNYIFTELGHVIDYYPGNEYSELDNYTLYINYTYYDDQKKSGKNQMQTIKNLRCINSGLVKGVVETGQLTGINTKYSI